MGWMCLILKKQPQTNAADDPWECNWDASPEIKQASKKDGWSKKVEDIKRPKAKGKRKHGTKQSEATDQHWSAKI